MFEFCGRLLGRGSARRDYLKFKPISSRVRAFNYTSWGCLVKKWSKMCFLSPPGPPLAGSIPSAPGAPVRGGRGRGTGHGVENWQETFFKSTIAGSAGSGHVGGADSRGNQEPHPQRAGTVFRTRTAAAPGGSPGQLLLNHRDEDSQDAKRPDQPEGRLFFLLSRLFLHVGTENSHSPNHHGQPSVWAGPNTRSARASSERSEASWASL